MNKQESKYFSTAILMDEAFIDLLEKKNIEYITVKEICLKAGVNRSTFYLHYESINDLIEETMDYINKKFVDHFQGNTDEFILKINTSHTNELRLISETYLIPYLTFVKDNRKIFHASFRNPIDMRTNERYKSLEKTILLPILERFHVLESDRKFVLAFYIHGIMAIIKVWLENDCKEDVHEINRLIIKYVEKE